MHSYIFLCIFAICGLCSCEKESSVQWKQGDIISTTINNTGIQLELAISKPTKTKGLMHRKNLPDNQGMLFVFKTPGKRSFWMKNTYIPLDIAYLNADGVIKEIHKMFPHNRNSVPSLSEDILYALEVNQGWFSKNQIQPGAQLDLTILNPILDQQQDLLSN